MSEQTKVDEIFGNVPDEGTAPIIETSGYSKTDGKKAEKELKEKAYQALEVTMSENPNFTDILSTLSDKIELVHSYGFGDKGNFIETSKGVKNPETGKYDNRELAPTSKIFGYSAVNNSDVEIPYTKTIYTRDADGKIVGSVVEKVWQPGEEIVLQTAEFTKMCLIPEISLKLANGKLVCGRKKANISIEERIASHHFAFNADFGKGINDDDVKINVSTKNDEGQFVVLPQYFDTFGFLEIKKQRGTGVAGSTKASISMQEAMANLMLQELKKKEQGSLV